MQYSEVIFGMHKNVEKGNKNMNGPAEMDSNAIRIYA
jgi:hypothetical protein